MDNITKVRTLIWDSGKNLFPEDPTIQEFLIDTADPPDENGVREENPYRCAAFLLEIIKGDHERVQQYSRGGVSVTYQKISSAIANYEQMAGDGGIQTASSRRV